MTVNYINMTAITTGERHRKKFSPRPLKDLEDSILLPMGLLHPIIVRQVAPDEYALVVGERRLRAIRNIHDAEKSFFFAGHEVDHEMIPCIVADPSLSDSDIYEAELDENIRREDLTWQERVSAISELHALRTKANPLHTFADTARELQTPAELEPGQLPPTTRPRSTHTANSVLIAEHLHDEDVANAPSERDALRIITRKMELLFAAATPRPTSPHTLHYGDFQSIHFEAGQFDTVITDPPYGVGVKHFGNAARLRHEYDEEDSEPLHQHLVELLTRSCAPDAHVFIFCDFDFFLTLKYMFTEYGWKVRRTPLIWSKGNMGHLPEGDVYGFKRSYELILVASRGDKSYKSLITDILHSEAPRNKIHAAQKPIELYTALLQISTYAGEFVFDPFAGSGPIFAAATEVGAIATGCEISEKFITHMEATYNLRRTS